MAVAFILAAIVLASLVFHALAPWRATPLASNWSAMDETYFITLLVTGLFFVVLNGFVVFAVARYRHKEGRRAAYLPNDHRLERRLIIATALGIIVLLAPGLFVYASYVRAPQDAIVVEAVAQQWQWRFRLPGTDGKLAKTDVRFVSATNPFGVDPGDPAAPGNVLVSGGELHLPVNKPVRMLLRSNDVLHDFYVPQFRGRMNIVPGMVTTFWFTPTTAGRYEILCAQLCGIGHFNMRGHVVVEDEASYQAWLKGQPVFATASAAGGGAAQPSLGPAIPAGSPAAKGQGLAQAKGCIACHSIDGTPGVGPTWKGLAGKSETLADGSAAVADAAYLQRSIVEPQTQIVKGFPPVMPKIDMSADEVAALVAYIQSLSAAPGAAPQTQSQK